ncbi:hypothetical protein ACFSTI_25325 [Rhizorhabdus histidinilytica]
MTDPIAPNPIANAGQFAAEEEVRHMWALPQTRAARDHAAQLWRVGHGTDIPDGLLDSFDSAMDGWVTNYLFKATAIDPAAPRIVRNFMPGYRWQGGDVPDARMGGDNPDNCYRLAGIAPGAAIGSAGASLTPAPPMPPSPWSRIGGRRSPPRRLNCPASPSTRTVASRSASMANLPMAGPIT